MKIDPLQQYTKLRRQLTDEKAQLEARLAEINAVLEPENIRIASSSLDKLATEYLEGALLVPASRRGRRPTGSTVEPPPLRKKQRTMSAEGRARISAAAKARWAKLKRSK